METYNFIALGGISLKFYQSQNEGIAPGLDTGGWGGVSLKSILTGRITSLRLHT